MFLIYGEFGTIQTWSIVLDKQQNFNFEKFFINSRWRTSGEEDTMYLDVSTSVMRFVVHTELRMRFPDILTTNSLGNSNKVIVAA